MHGIHHLKLQSLFLMNIKIFQTFTISVRGPFWSIEGTWMMLDHGSNELDRLWWCFCCDRWNISWFISLVSLVDFTADTQRVLINLSRMCWTIFVFSWGRHWIWKRLVGEHLSAAHEERDWLGDLQRDVSLKPGWPKFKMPNDLFKSSDFVGLELGQIHRPKIEHPMWFYVRNVQLRFPSECYPGTEKHNRITLSIQQLWILHMFQTEINRAGSPWTTNFLNARLDGSMLTRKATSHSGLGRKHQPPKGQSSLQHCTSNQKAMVRSWMWN